jgi:hypothetical protein
VREQFQTPSLLPYLDPGTAGVHLKICLLTEDSSAPTNNPSPFLVVADSDPISRLIKAQFTTDSGSKVKDVFLLAQRDDYRLSPNQLVPLANPDIEAFWQKTYEYQCQSGADYPLITLRRQIDKNGSLVQFQPLFFCQVTRTFFHPPCPKCGISLQQCYNDQLVDSLGMHKYSTSLSRYLFCPSCFSSGKEANFYAHRLRASDPPLVKGAEDLIRAFEQSVRDRNEGSGLPCAICRQNEQCFGSGASPVTTIVPFSFYPFFMIIYEAMPLNGLDFLALVSGASFDEMEARIKESGEMGRVLHHRASKVDYTARSPFLFKDDARLFWETLYLKLSFLVQIVTELFPEPDNRRPDPLLYADRIWVKLTDKAGLLPYLWNFELSFIDLVRGPLGVPAHPQLPLSYSLHLLGLIWFTSLLANSKQDISQVHLAVEEARNRVVLTDQSAPDELMMDSVFFPENIFWHPEPSNLPQDWRSLWTEALGIGWSLFQASISGESLWSKEGFTQRIGQLRAGVKKELFLRGVAEPLEDQHSSDEAIREILSRISTKWCQFRISKPEETLEETVLLSGKGRYEPAFSPDSEAEMEQISETMILEPSKTTGDIEPVIDEEFFQETVVLSGKGLRQEMPTANLHGEEAERELAETVILKSKEEEPLSETIIISPSGDQLHRPSFRPGMALENQASEQAGIPSRETEKPLDAKAKSRKPGDEDDSLSETMILTPRKDRDKK